MDILNGLWYMLTRDSEFLSLLGLNEQSTISEKAQKVQKEKEPNGLVLETVPLVCIYPEPGLPSKYNFLLYEAEIQVDIYADSLYKCTQIGKYIQTLWSGKLPPVDDGATFELEFYNDFSGESDIQGIKKYSQRWVLGDVVWR